MSFDECLEYNPSYAVALLSAYLVNDPTGCSNKSDGGALHGCHCNGREEGGLVDEHRVADGWDFASDVAVDIFTAHDLGVGIARSGTLLVRVEPGKVLKKSVVLLTAGTRNYSSSCAFVTLSDVLEELVLDAPQGIRAECRVASGDILLRSLTASEDGIKHLI